MASQAVKGRVSTQPGSIHKKWDKEELARCGSIGTTEPRILNLRGEVHPVFANWATTNDPDLRRELEQPLLLASKILEAAGLPWLSDFLIDDIFDPGYPGCEPDSSFRPPTTAYDDDDDDDDDDNYKPVPWTIVRHHRAPWATSAMRKGWLDSTRSILKNQMARSMTWQLDADMFRERGWVGYTCRHPRHHGLPLEELDRYETIEWFDRAHRRGGGGRYRDMTILVTAEYPQRLADLRRRGGAHGEAYLLTAFMTAVTVLHELGHAIYWKDSRSLTREPREPFYGADLEMELGDSFVASVFGGWVPVPVREPARLREEAFAFDEGVAWRQALSWDRHRLRPKHRAHYSVPVGYIARLFSEDSWSRPNGDHLEEDLIRPRSLVGGDGTTTALATVGICPRLSRTGQHATAALPDFRCGDGGEGYAWDRRPGARFRIPQYDGCVCPDLDLPTATDDVVREPAPQDPNKPGPQVFMLGTTATKSPPGRASEKKGGQKTKTKTKKGDGPEQRGDHRHYHHHEAEEEKQEAGEMQVAETTTTEEELPRVRLNHSSGVLSPDRSEISVDELKKQLSRLIGVSLNELEKLFETPQCG